MAAQPEKTKIDIPGSNLGHKFLPGHPSFDARYPVVIGLILTFIAVFAFAHAAAVTTAEDTVILSDGQAVQLGETKSDLAASLKSDLHVVNDSFYQYPADPKKPVEALIYAQAERVTAIEVIGGSNNVHVASGLKVGLLQPLIQAGLAQRLRLLDPQLISVRYRGFAMNQTNSEAYFLTPPCAASTQVINFTLVLKTYAPILQSKSIPVDCNNTSN